jgi:MFS transporter, DHA2 family, methylenomycin A resistance protein
VPASHREPRFRAPARCKTRPRHEKWKGRWAPPMHSDKRVLIAISLAFATVTLDSNALSVATPSIGHSFAGSLSDLQWVTDGYLLTFASFLLSTGRLADRFGSKTTLSFGVAGFAICSILCAVSPDLAFLIVLRILQGIAAAVLATSCFSLLAHVFPDGPKRGNAFAVMNISGSLGACAGPLVGGVLVGLFGWQSIFWLNLPVAICIMLGIRGLSDPAKHRHLAFDVLGQMLSIISLGAFVTMLIEGPATQWSSTTSVVSCLVFAATAAGFVVAERHQNDPLLPSGLLGVRSFVATSLACGVWRFSLYGLLFFLSLYFQNVRHYSTELTGLAFLPVLAAPMLTQPQSARLLRRHGIVITAGSAFAIAAFGAGLIAWSSNSSYWVTGVGLSFVGLGGGLAMPALGQTSLAEIPKQSLGVASGIFNAFGQVGSLIGVAVLGALLRGNSVHELRTSGVVVSAVFLCGIGVLAVGARKATQLNKTSLVAASIND